MQDAMRAGARIASLLMMAVLVAHCGDSSVHIQTGNGVSPSPGTFSGFTDRGEPLTIQVGSIEAVAFECDGIAIAQTFTPPAQVNNDGTFNVGFNDAGRHFRVSGRFSDNNSVDGIVDDENNACDTGFQATRGGVTPPTKTPGASTPHVTMTPGPGETTPVETETPTTAETETPGPVGTGPTETPGPGTPTATATPTGSSCPSQITFTGTSTNGVLDTGWTGNGHDATVVSDGTVTVSVTGCSGTAPNCGVCSYTGPVANATGQHLIQNHRCNTDSAIACTGDSDCGSNGPCKFFFGTYLPLAAGGVSTCVQNTFAGGISGTADLASGSSVGSASVTSRVFNGITLSNPCPQCNGDGTTNDGVKGGTCVGGLHPGAACDVTGASPNQSFGKTSLDCPPVAGAVIATLPINLDNTTGNKTRTLSASSPPCTAGGWTTNRCQCDTCDDAASTPCASNADCGGSHICGGLRCTGGSAAGTPCPVAGTTTLCPGSACGRKGTATAANQCDAGSGDCAADPGTPSPNDRKCVTGPGETFCGPVETFRGCGGDSDCSFPGDTCSVSRFRDCFDNGTVGEAVQASGHAVAPVNHQSNPTLAALFCIGPTTSASVNNAAGLPGLGRLELTGHAVDNGTT